MRTRVPVVVLFALALAAAGPYARGQLSPPVARQAPTTIEIHGRTLVDPYAWLANGSDPEVISYLEAENRYSQAVMKDAEPLREQLFQEMVFRTDDTAPQPPRFVGEDAYYVRPAAGAQYLLLCRRIRGMTGREEVLLDLNRFAAPGRKPAFGVWRISPDSRLLAVSVDFDGSESFTIFVQSLEGRRREVARIDGAGRWLEWAADSRTLFYSSPYGQAPGRLMRCRVESCRSDADTVYSEPAQGTGLGLMKTATGRHLVLITYGTEWEIRILRASDPSGDFRVLAPRRKGVRYWLAEEGGAFYLMENTAGASSRIARTPTDGADGSRWEEVLGSKRGWIVSDFDVAAGRLLAVIREGGLSRVQVLDPSTGEDWAVPFPESLSSVRVVSGFERDPQPARLGRGASAHFSFESFVRPTTLFDYDPVSRRLRETWRAAVHGYRPGDHAADRVFATASDGTQIPVSLVYRKPLVLDGRRPLLLYGFGFVGLAAGPTFESERVSLLDRGVIFAVAHVRGGGDFGLAWHEAATGLAKMRTFTDFIACAEHLIAKGYTSSGGLAITGTSAGGMLVTAAANMRPDLMRAVVAKVPATVVIRRAPGSDRLQENAELGNPNREEDFNAMMAYAPYYNVKAQVYPHMLITASRSDPRVSFDDPVKLAARLRSVKMGDRMLLLRVDMAGGGHTGSPGREDQLSERAFEYAFLLRALGIDR